MNSLLKKYLQPEERVNALIRWHWSANLFLVVLLTVGTFVIWGFVYGTVGQILGLITKGDFGDANVNAGWTMFVVLLQLGLFALVAWFYFSLKSNGYLLTNKRILAVHGVIFPSVSSDITYGNVASVNVKNSPFESLLGGGSVLIKLHDGETKELIFVSNPYAVRQEIERMAGF